MGGPKLTELFSHSHSQDCFSFLNKLSLFLSFFLLFIYLFYFMCMRFPAFMQYVCALHACLVSLEVRRECRCQSTESPCRCQKLYQGHLKEQTVICFFKLLSHPFFKKFKYIFKDRGFHYVALAGLELTLQAKLALSEQNSTCLYLLSAGVKGCYTWLYFYSLPSVPATVLYSASQEPRIKCPLVQI